VLYNDITYAGTTSAALRRDFDEADVRAGKVKVSALCSLQHAASENVIAGNAMKRPRQPTSSARKVPPG